MEERIVSTSFVGITVAVISKTNNCDISIHIPQSLIPKYGFENYCPQKFRLKVKLDKTFEDDLKIKISKKLYPTDRYGFIQTSKSTKLKTNFTGNGYSGYIELYPKAYFSNQRIQKIQLEKEKLLRRANKKSILTAIF